jgi:hypothetical protein
MSDELLSARDLALVDAVAQRVLELLGERDARSRLVSAGELAALLGRSREWVYEHAEDLGGRRIGDGERPRLWFDVDRALSGRLTAEGRSHPVRPRSLGNRAIGAGAHRAATCRCCPLAAERVRWRAEPGSDRSTCTPSRG